tara:strand:+ start:390 stop:1289 length:900 start_codon:yes stop_codon:yes gene_type:complete
MNLLPFVIGPAVSAVGSIIGGNKAASAARESANLQNEAAQRQLEYDTEAWEMKKQQLISQRDYAVQEIEIKALNEGKQAAFQDASKARQYNYDLQIRNRQQASNEQQFKRSNEIYDNQLTLNEQAYVRGREKEIAKFDETVQEAAYDSNEAYIDSLMAEGKLRARGVTGRTADKLAATSTLQFGTKMAMLNASINNAALNSQFTLESLGRERSAADLRAYASRMLDPGELPMPIEPLPTPMSTYIYPRVFEDYDFGPEPVIGALASPGAAASQVWGTTISSIAGAVGSGFNSYATYMNR